MSVFIERTAFSLSGSGLISPCAIYFFFPVSIGFVIHKYNQFVVLYRNECMSVNFRILVPPINIIILWRGITINVQGMGINYKIIINIRAQGLLIMNNY